MLSSQCAMLIPSGHHQCACAANDQDLACCRFATAILIGCTLLALALTGLLAFPFVQEQTGAR